MYSLYKQHDKERIIVILQKMDCDVGLGGGWRGEFQDDDKSGSAAGRDGFFHQTSNRPSITSLSWSGWPKDFPNCGVYLNPRVHLVLQFSLYFARSLFSLPCASLDGQVDKATNFEFLAAISSVRDLNNFDQITDLSACSFTLYNSSLHRLWEHEDGQNRVNEGLTPSKKNLRSNTD